MPSEPYGKNTPSPDRAPSEVKRRKYLVEKRRSVEFRPMLDDGNYIARFDRCHLRIGRPEGSVQDAVSIDQS